MMTDERWNQLRACHNQWAWDCDEQGEVIAELDRLRAENARLESESEATLEKITALMAERNAAQARLAEAERLLGDTLNPINEWLKVLGGLADENDYAVFNNVNAFLHLTPPPTAEERARQQLEEEEFLWEGDRDDNKIPGVLFPQHPTAEGGDHEPE